MPLSDILNCAENELWDILDSDDAYQQEGWFLSKNIGMIELSQLGEMLGVVSYDELMAQFNLIGEPRDEGPWPVTIPSSLINKIRNLTDQEIASVLPKWASIEEFHGNRPHDFLSDYMTQLREYLTGRDGEFFLVNAL